MIFVFFSYLMLPAGCYFQHFSLQENTVHIKLMTIFLSHLYFIMLNYTKCLHVTILTVNYTLVQLSIKLTKGEPSLHKRQV